jgi:CheY-like chemotaxis protein
MIESTLRLFHIDDDEDDRFFVQRAVRAAALPILLSHAASGPEALTRLQAGEIIADLLLLDIRMPGMSGFEFIEAFKRAVAPPRPPIVVYSNSDQERDVERARELGAHAYCVKPSGLQPLVEFVTRLYHSWREGEIPCEWPQRTRAAELK